MHATHGVAKLRGDGARAGESNLLLHRPDEDHLVVELRPVDAVEREDQRCAAEPIVDGAGGESRRAEARRAFEACDAKSRDIAGGRELVAEPRLHLAGAARG